VRCRDADLSKRFQVVLRIPCHDAHARMRALDSLPFGGSARAHDDEVDATVDPPIPNPEATRELGRAPLPGNDDRHVGMRAD
jgi:hypothetical protein